MSARVRFGAFELDLRTGELRQSGRKIPLQEQPFRVLQILVESGGRIATREEIQNKLWPNNTIVDFDHSINTAIKKIRAALGDSAEDPKYIETVGRRGYRLMPPVERVSSSGDVPRGAEEAAGEDVAAGRIELEADSLAGTMVSHYRVLEVVGGGGMGVVYRAEDVKLGRAVALKFLPEDVGRDPRALERFEREARAASALDHPNLCSIHEFGEHEGRPFLVMQLLQGQTLRQRLADAPGHALALGQLVDYGIQIANGLEAAHEKGILHRDIKPANIFVTDKGVVKILDFGLAKLTEATEEDSSGGRADSQSGRQPAVGEASEAENLSRPGVVLGTAAYMSPEQARGEKLDARTDLFSFGLVVYEMATGRQAFDGGNAEVLRDAILNRQPTPVLQLKPDLPPRLGAIIGKCLQKKPGLRYQRASDVRSDLERVRLESARPSPVRWIVTAVAAAVVLVALVAGGLYWRSGRTPALTEKDTVVVSDFKNTTGDVLWDDTLKTALTVQLEHSPFLNVLSDQRVGEALKLMNRSSNEKLTPQLAREVCVRTGSKALVAGSIGAVGEHYLIELTATNCNTGDVLASAGEEAENRNQVLKRVRDVTNQLRGRLGESLVSVQKYDTPLEQATTPSLEALQAYTRAKRIQMSGESDSIPYFKRALELDENFAAAYAALGTEYENRGQSTLAIANYQRAYDLRNRVSQRERLNIEGHYYDAVTGEMEKAIQNYKEASLKDPRDTKPHQNLSVVYEEIGQYDKAVEEAQETMRLAPDNVGPYAILEYSYNALNQPEKAKAAFDQARVHKLDDPSLRQYRYYAAFLLQDDATMTEQVTWAMGKARAEDLLLSTHSDTEAYRGQFTKARELSQRATESAKHADSPETGALWKVYEALREAEIGDVTRSQRASADAMALMPARDVRVLTALSLARSGKVTQAQTMLDKLDHEFPLDTLMQDYSLPTVRAAIELERNNPDKAVEALKATAPYELGGRSITYLYPPYLRGVAYLKASNAQRAAAEFRKVLDHPGIVLNFVTGALAHLQLGRAEAMMGDTAAARKSYQDFFALWKDADPDIPILKQAKSEYAKLQ